MSEEQHQEVTTDDTQAADAAPPDDPSVGQGPCPECGGSGRVDGSECSACGGSGQLASPIGGG